MSYRNEPPAHTFNDFHSLSLSISFHFILFNGSFYGAHTRNVESSRYNENWMNVSTGRA